MEKFSCRELCTYHLLVLLQNHAFGQSALASALETIIMLVRCSIARIRHCASQLTGTNRLSTMVVNILLRAKVAIWHVLAFDLLGKC